MKFRVIEAKNGMFYPQFSSGWTWFWGWDYFHAEALGTMERLPLVRAISTKDYGFAAKFSTKQEAEEFIIDACRIADQYHARRDASREREFIGIDTKQKHKFELCSLEGEKP